MKATPTKYLVLVRPSEGQTSVDGDAPATWIEYDRVEATSQDAAVRNALKDGSPNGLYLALPLRSYNPLDVQVKNKPAFAIGKPADG